MTVALILAGGHDSRLEGRPLLDHAVAFATEFGVRDTLAVVNPTIAERVGERYPNVLLATQLEPTGVIEALRIGTAALGIFRPDSADARLLLLCSDNTFDPDGAWFARTVADRPTVGFVGVNCRSDETGRFTTVAARTLVPRRPSREPRQRWVGPLLLPSVRRLRYALALRGSVELEVVLNVAGAPFETVAMGCEDRGVAE